LALASGIGAIAVAAIAYSTARFFAPPELRWRLRVVETKVRGELKEIPAFSLIAWLAPPSPVYLRGGADRPNLHVSINNLLTTEEDAAQGKLLYLRQCGGCHGEGGHGESGPDLLKSVSTKSDWAFFSTAKWGRPGTSMQAQPLSDTEIWQIHAYLRG